MSTTRWRPRRAAAPVGGGSEGDHPPELAQAQNADHEEGSFGGHGNPGGSHGAPTRNQEQIEAQVHAGAHGAPEGVEALAPRGDKRLGQEIVDVSERDRPEQDMKRDLRGRVRATKDDGKQVHRPEPAVDGEHDTANPEYPPGTNEIRPEGSRRPASGCRESREQDRYRPAN
jgi:hypothetical protein